MLTITAASTGFISTNMIPDADGRASLFWPYGIAYNEAFLATERHHLVSFAMSWYDQYNSYQTTSAGTRLVWMMQGYHGIVLSLSGQFMDNPAWGRLYLNGSLLVAVANSPEDAVNNDGTALYTQYGVFDCGRVGVGTTGWQTLSYSMRVLKPAYTGTGDYQRKNWCFSVFDSLLWAPGPAFAEGMRIEI